MPMDAYRGGDTFVVALDLPGVDPGSIDLDVERNVLTVKAERKPQYPDDVEMIIGEHPRGSFSRQMFLGDTLDTDRIEAHYDAGVPPCASRSPSRRGRARSRSPAARPRTRSAERQRSNPVPRDQSQHRRARFRRPAPGVSR
jgi:hypothetical protein